MNLCLSEIKKACILLNGGVVEFTDNLTNKQIRQVLKSWDANNRQNKFLKAEWVKFGISCQIARFAGWYQEKCWSLCLNPYPIQK